MTTFPCVGSEVTLADFTAYVIRWILSCVHSDVLQMLVMWQSHC